jgi:inorganic triphosphatase YgiF
MALEVEARFRADPDTLVRLAELDRIGDATLGPGRTAEEVDRYLDTDDGRLAAARWACRLRTRDGVTRISLKGPAEAAAAERWLHRRPELEGPATGALDPSEWPASEARSHLESLTGGHPLRERFHLAQRRTERPVVLEGARLGTLSLDAVDVRRPDGRGGGTLEIVELELATADPASEAHLAGLAAALAAIEGLTPEPRTKLEHALERLSDG